MKGRTIFAMTLAAGLALPTLGFGQARTETGTGGGVNQNATSTHAATATDTDTDTATSAKTKKKTTVSRVSRKNRSQKNGTEPTTTNAAATDNTTGATGAFPTTREPGHRKTMNGLGRGDDLNNGNTEQNGNNSGGR